MPCCWVSRAVLVGPARPCTVSSAWGWAAALLSWERAQPGITSAFNLCPGILLGSSSLPGGWGRMGPWGEQISKHCWVNPLGVTGLCLSLPLAAALRCFTLAPSSSVCQREKHWNGSSALPWIYSGRSYGTETMRELWGAAAAPAAPLILWGGLHKAECEGQSKAASCRSRGRSCLQAVPAAPAAQCLDRCSSSLESVPSGDEESSQQEPQEIRHPGSCRQDRAL